MLAKTFGSAVHVIDARTILIKVNVSQVHAVLHEWSPRRCSQGKSNADIIRSQEEEVFYAARKNGHDILKVAAVCVAKFRSELQRLTVSGADFSVYQT